MRYKKGQLSVEAMIIYGLVILVALSVVGALIYFDVLDLGSYLPDSCDLGGTGDLKCEEMKFSGNSIELGIRNIGQKSVNSVRITVDDEDDAHFTGSKSSAGGVSIAPGSIELITIDVSPDSALPDRTLRAILKTEYQLSGGVVTQESSGTLRIRAT